MSQVMQYWSHTCLFCVYVQIIGALNMVFFPPSEANKFGWSVSSNAQGFLTDRLGLFLLCFKGGRGYSIPDQTTLDKKYMTISVLVLIKFIFYLFIFILKFKFMYC